jgi:F-type H+-transporting ATPase subunit b
LLPFGCVEGHAVLCRVFTLLMVVSCWAAVASLAAAQEEKTAEKAPAAHTEAAPADAAHAPGADHGKADQGKAAHAADAHAAGHHDPNDLGHGNASANLHSPADLKFDMSIFSFLVFLILLAVLYKFAWGPIARALEQREETIARQIEEARLASEKAALSLREYEARLAAATDEARQIVAASRKDAELAKDRIVAEARDAAQKERERAVAEIGVAKNQALDEIAQRSVQTAVSLASQLIRREVRPQEHEALIGEAIDKFSNVN